jgi:subtilisin family serine protease
MNGWDFYNNDNTVFDGHDPNALVDWHGTAVAGEIVSHLNNGIGGAGVAPNIQVIPAKFLGPTGGTTAGAIAALDYLTDLKLRHGIDIVATNNSYDSQDAESVLLEAAIQRGADAGIMFVTISGNGNSKGIGYNLDTAPNYPASLHCHFASGPDCMIVVTAIDRTGKLPKFANFGASTVDIAAPGEHITSTFPFDQYRAASGTSFAGPLVAAAVALYHSTYPLATPTQIRAAILDSATKSKALQGTSATGGRLDLQVLFHL